MHLQGKIVQILPLEQGTSKAGNAWKKQNYILETAGQYPKKVCFDLFGDNVDKFPMQVGQDVTLDVNVESREYNGRWYTNITAWNVSSTSQPAGGYAQPAPPTFAPQPQPAPPVTQAVAPQPVGADALPF